ncbi:hypothetical protein DL93DRAFT_2216348 [Clavulina sp. PMI_390]|nr:hypothetical protein DL93DRAFT_2216348 [Clavulina sp. PMI_390]
MESNPNITSTTANDGLSLDSASFADDPHIHWDGNAKKWLYEKEDGSELEFNETTREWVPTYESLLRAQQAAYSIAGVDEEAPVDAVLKRENKKRKEVDYTSNTTTPPPTESGPSARKRGKKNNTAVYITGLPPDATASELAARFGKFGVLMEDDEGAPRVKLYADASTGEFNGEALVVYFMEDSVDLAITMLDDAPLRLEEPGTTMRVKKADFAHKGSGGATVGDGKPAVKRVVDKKKATERINKMKSKLADWDSSDEDDPQAKAPASKSRTVLLKHMFRLADLEQDPGLLLDLKDDVREECETLGEVTNVVLYDLEPDGIMTVKFKDLVSAQACVIKMNGRFFDGLQVEASLFDGKGSKFRRSDRGGPAAEDDDDDDAEEKKRLDAFASWLEAGGEAKGSGAGPSTS